MPLGKKMEAPSQERCSASFLSPFRSRVFGLLWAATVVSNIGVDVQRRRRLTMMSQLWPPARESHGLRLSQISICWPKLPSVGSRSRTWDVCDGLFRNDDYRWCVVGRDGRLDRTARHAFHRSWRRAFGDTTDAHWKSQTGARLDLSPSMHRPEPSLRTRWKTMRVP